MNDKWDLGILYDSFDSDEYRSDLASLDDSRGELSKLAEGAAALADEELLKAYVALSEELSSLTRKLYIYASLRYSADTADAEAASVMGRLMDKLGRTAASDTVLNQRIAAIGDLDAAIDRAELGEYRYFLNNIKRDSKYLLSDREEALFAKLNISGASSWENLQSTLTSTVKVDYRGEKITLSAARNLAYDPSASVRRDAYEAELKCYENIKDSVAFALNSITLQVLNECDVRGYASPLDRSLYKSRMKKETLDALLSAIEEYLPHFHRYLRAKAKALGHENGMPWYDMFAPMGSSDKKYTTEDARDYLLNIFKKFDRELYDMVKRAFDESWIDFYPRNGKVGGAFDCGVPSAKQSRVLTNFDGSFGDIVTLAHELGHSFHDSRVFAHSVLNQDYSMPVAETASTFNENLVVSTAIAESTDKAEKLALIESQLMDACQIICDIYSRFLFESSVFENRANEFMNADRLSEMMLDAQKKAYGDGLDHSCLHPYMWLCKGHYYSGSLSFYNFPYAFGGLFARGLYAKYVSEGEAFVEMYKKLLTATSTSDVEECAMIAGIDLTDRDFWKSGLDSFAAEIDEFCKLVEEK